MTSTMTVPHEVHKQLDWKAGLWAGVIAGGVFMMREMARVWLFLGESPCGLSGLSGGSARNRVRERHLHTAGCSHKTGRRPLRSAISICRAILRERINAILRRCAAFRGIDNRAAVFFI